MVSPSSFVFFTNLHVFVKDVTGMKLTLLCEMTVEVSSVSISLVDSVGLVGLVGLLERT